MKVIFSHQKTCLICGEFLEPKICSDLNYDEEKNGSIWRCEKCQINFPAKDRTPLEHLELIKSKYADNDVFVISKEGEPR